MEVKCTHCPNLVEEERIELLNSKICSHCAKSGIDQLEVRAATFQNGDGTTEIQIMDLKSFETFDRSVRARDGAHGCS